MQRRLWVFPLTVLLAATVQATTVQAALAEDEWEENNTKGAAALSDGRYPDAEKLFLAAKKESEKSGAKYGHYATTLLNLGQVYDKMDRVPDSEKAYKEALAVYEKSYGPTTAEDGKALQGLAETYRHHAKYLEAVPLYQRALKIRDVLIPTHPDTADTLNGLAEVFRKLGKNSDALPLFKRALDIRREAFGPTHPKTARALDNLTSTYAAVGKYDMAIPVYKDLLSARESINGVEDPKVAQVLEDMGYACSKTDKLKKADGYFKKALAIRETNAKKDPSAYATCIKRYAEFMRNTDRKDEAAKLEAKLPGGATAKTPAAGAATPTKTAVKQPVGKSSTK